jgi:hypothetical protein
MLDGGWLFPRLNPIESLSARQLNRAIHAAAEAAGIDKRVPDRSLQAACVRGVGTQRRLQRTSGSLDKQRSQIDVSAQADVTQPRLATRAVLAWG